MSMSTTRNKKVKFSFKGFAMNVAFSMDDKAKMGIISENGFDVTDFLAEITSEGYQIKFSHPADDGVITVSILGMPETPNDGMILSQRHIDIRKACVALHYIHTVLGEGDVWKDQTELAW